MKKLFKILLILVLVFLSIAAIAIAYVKIALPDAGNPPDLKVELSPERIARGKYLANNVAVCMDCHSTRDWSVFAGPIKEGTFGMGGELFGHNIGFPGEFYSRNINPAGLGEWTDGEIFHTITTGVNKKGEALFPIMPYVRYRNMDKEDIYDIIAYLRTLKPSPSVIPEREIDFPLNIIVNTIPKPAEAVQKPDPSDRVNYGKYMVNTASCMFCHTKNHQGEMIAGTEFGGGFEFRFPEGVVTSANISPDTETGIGNWSESAFISRFKAYADSSYTPPKMKPGELNTPMPWLMFCQMTEQDLGAIYAYLRTVKPIKNKVEKFSPENKAQIFN